MGAREAMRNPVRLLIAVSWVALLLMTSLQFSSSEAAAYPADTGVVTGRVVDQNGQGLAGINVQLTRGGAVANHTVTDTDGSWGMRAQAGDYELVVNGITTNLSVTIVAGQTNQLPDVQIYSTKNYAWIAIDVTIVAGGFVLLLVARNRKRIRQGSKK